MRVTSRYWGLTLSRNVFFRSLILWLYRNVSKKILSNSKTNNVLLLREDFNRFYINKKNSFYYESLYNSYLQTINLEEFSNLIKKLIENSSKFSEIGINLRTISVYLFVPFFHKWCPLIEFAHSKKMKGERELFYVGRRSDSEFQILSKVICGNERNAEYISTISDKTLHLMAKMKLLINHNKKYNFSGFNLYPKVTNTMKSKFQKNIVIPIQEDRRFLRIKRLCEEFEKNNFSTTLFAFDLKAEELAELKKYPELVERVVFADDLLDPQEVSNLQKKIIIDLNKMIFKLKHDKEINKITYRGIPLYIHAWEDLEDIILLRGVQLAIYTVAINRLLSLQKIDAFIGFDNSINTCAWMSVCEERSIPSFLHFYNAVLSPVIYQLLVDSFKPTAWLLGGERQMNKFKEIKNAENYFITGDIFLDAIVSANHQHNLMKVKNSHGILSETKNIVLLSSYVTDDYTEERKRTIFTLVDGAARQLGVSLIVKAHPNEDIAVLKSQMKVWKINRPILHSENLLNLLFTSDLVCMYMSEAAQQAMSVGVPVLSLVPAEISLDLDKHWGYYSSGAVAWVPLGEDPKSFIADLLFDHHSRQNLISKGYEYIDLCVGKRDGNNAKRMVEVVKNYC